MWLLHEDTARSIRMAHASGFTPSPDAIAAATVDVVEAADGGMPRNAEVVGDVMRIDVSGVLTKRPDFMAMFFGGGNTTYASIIDALAIAAVDPRVASVELRVDSPGGAVDGLFDVLGAIEAFRADKPIAVLAENALSAAYAIAAVAGSVEATSVGSRFGSIGVAVSLRASEDVIDLTNSESPNKRPDASTEEGRAVIVDHLDAVFDLFVDAIARGRGVTVAKATESFGRGSTFVAGQAVDLGMVDTIRGNLRVVQGGASAVAEAVNVAASQDLIEAAPAVVLVEGATASAANSGGKKTESSSMDLITLRTSHPAVYQAVVQEGVTQERDRVVAHITLGRQANDLGIACEAIEAGDEMTQTMTARYMAAGMNHADRTARQADSDEAGEAVDNAAAETTETAEAPDLGDAVVALLDGKK